MTYDLPVMEEKVKPHQVTTLHMVAALAFIVTGVIIVTYNYTIPLWGGAILLVGIALTVLVMGRNKWVISGKINPAFRFGELLVAGGICAYSVAQHWKFPIVIFGALSAALLFALYWERPGSQLFVHIDKDGIKLPDTGRRKQKPWGEIEQVILRFGILTINCTDNSLYQWDISTAEVDSEIFEAYCSTQIEENKKSEKEKKDDW